MLSLSAVQQYAERNQFLVGTTVIYNNIAKDFILENGNV